MKENVKIFRTPDADNMPFAIESIGISYCDETYRMVRKKARVNVIEYIVSGTGTVKTSSGIFYPSAGDSYVLRAGEWHDYYCGAEEPWTKIWINFRGKLAAPILDAYGLSKSMLLPNLNTSEYLKKIHEIFRVDFTDLDTINSECSVVFLQLCQFIQQNLSIPTHVPLVSDNIEKLKNYIDLHLNEPLTLEKCSSITYLSASQTIRSFRQAYGMPPHKYLAQQRIESAKYLLRTSSLNIQAIALQVGFDDANYFSKYFKKLCGKSPKQYRDSH